MQYVISTNRSYRETVNDLRQQGLDSCIAEQLAQQAQLAKSVTTIDKIKHFQAVRRLSSYTHLFD